MQSHARIRFQPTGVLPGLGLALTFLSFSSCLAPGALNVSQSTATVTTPTTPTTTTVNTISGDVYLKVEREWEGVPASRTEALLCKVPEGSAPTDLVCNVTIPEAEVYMSHLYFTWGSSNTSACKVVVFHPYYYQGSNAAGYFPPKATSTTALDCSLLPTPADCYTGVASEIVPGFPIFDQILMATAEATEQVSVASSPFSLNYINNRYVANSKSDTTAGIAGEYLANSMQHYQVDCRDEYYDLISRVTVIIKDQDTLAGEDPGGALDHFSDWD